MPTGYEVREATEEEVLKSSTPTGSVYAVLVRLESQLDELLKVRMAFREKLEPVTGPVTRLAELKAEAAAQDKDNRPTLACQLDSFVNRLEEETEALRDILRAVDI